MIVIHIPLRPWTVNAERTMHYRKRTKLIRAYRKAARDAAWGMGSLQCPVSVDVSLFLRGRRSQDTGACYGALKAAVDGLVDARVLAGDTHEHISAITMHAPVLDCESDLMWIVVRSEA